MHSHKWRILATYEHGARIGGRLGYAFNGNVEIKECDKCSRHQRRVYVDGHYMALTDNLINDEKWKNYIEPLGSD